jgi:hypothetical protein
VKRPATRHAARQRPHRPRFAKPFSHFVRLFEMPPPPTVVRGEKCMSLRG